MTSTQDPVTRAVIPGPREPTEPANGVATSPSYDVCRVQIAGVSPSAAAAHIVDAALAPRAFQVHLCNAFTLSLVGRDAELLAALRCADLNLPDGAPVAWLGRKCGVRGPVRGPQLVWDVVRAGAGRGVRHYLYGGAPGVAEEMRLRLATEVPGSEIAGTESPTYRAIDATELAAIAARVRASRANVVWVGLGTPRQDYLVPRLAALVDAAVVPVGAAFDFISGRVGEAPPILHGTGLEWLHRFSREPRRLWRRYLVGNPRFVVNVVRCRSRRAETPAPRTSWDAGAAP